MGERFAVVSEEDIKLSDVSDLAIRFSFRYLHSFFVRGMVYCKMSGKYKVV